MSSKSSHPLAHAALRSFSPSARGEVAQGGTIMIENTPSSAGGSIAWMLGLMVLAGMTGDFAAVVMAGAAGYAVAQALHARKLLELLRTRVQSLEADAEAMFKLEKQVKAPTATTRPVPAATPARVAPTAETAAPTEPVPAVVQRSAPVLQRAPEPVIERPPPQPLPPPQSSRPPPLHAPLCLPNGQADRTDGNVGGRGVGGGLNALLRVA